METKKEFTFDYSKYRSKKIDLDQLDRVMEVVISSGTSTFKTIVAATKVVIYFCYLWARKRLIDEQMEIARQNYEQNRVNETDDVLQSDDLDEAIEEDNLD